MAAIIFIRAFWPFGTKAAFRSIHPTISVCLPVSLPLGLKFWMASILVTWNGLKWAGND